MKDLPDLKELTDEAKDALNNVTAGRIVKITSEEVQKDLQEFEPSTRQRLQN
jgi:hypothetical protein